MHQDVDVVPCTAAQASVNNQIEARLLKEPSWTRVIDSYQRDGRLFDAPLSSRVEAALGYGRDETQCL